MKQLLILSGKGGTGKTTIASAFIRFSDADAFADCDVDAPNLHLVVAADTEPETDEFFGMPKAEIDPAMCIGCGECLEHCRFDAISNDSGSYEVKKADCEGCGVCELVCPADAVTLRPAVAGDLLLYKFRDKVFSTARLRAGGGHSGMLVTEVKKRMRENAGAAPLAIVDGSPGIGCPVIASMSGVDMVLIVTEPSVSGISDMERIVKTAGIFGTKTAVCVNKCDTNPDNTERIEKLCRDSGLAFVGKLPFDPEAVRAVNRGATIADVDCPSGRAAKEVFDRTMQLLFA